METRHLEFEDFCGTHFEVVMYDISQINPADRDRFFNLIDSNPDFSELIYFFLNLHTSKIDWDDMARLVVAAFHANKLTRHQAAALLEYRSIKSDFPKTRVVNIFKSNGEMSDDFLNLMSKLTDSESKTRFIELLKGKKKFECCYYEIEIDNIKDKDPKIPATLGLAKQLNIIHYVSPIIDTVNDRPKKNELEAKDIHYVSYLNTVMRDLLTQAVYGIHAKNLYPRLGIFTVDDIERSVKKNGRYSAIDYPRVPCAKEFHGIEAKEAFYNFLHDEIHRIFISTIPNPVFLAYLHLIEVVREKTGLKPATKNGKDISMGVFSKEIWDGIDMDCGLFLKDTRKEDVRNKEVTNDFIKMMQVDVYTENRPVGLCSPSAYMDTTWLVMIDMVLNKAIWKEKYLIDTEMFAYSNAYRPFYQFVVKCKDLLSKETLPAKQVALIKSLWFEMSYAYSRTKSYEFKRKDNYIELVCRKEPPMNLTQCSKKIDMQMLRIKDVEQFYDPSFLASNKNLFHELFLRTLQSENEFNNHIHTIREFNLFIEHATEKGQIIKLNQFLNNKIVGLFRDVDANIKNNIFKGAYNFFKSILKLMRKNDVLINFAEQKSSYDDALHLAAFLGQLDKAKELLKHNYTIFFYDENHNTPIHFAIANKQILMVDFLFTEMTNKSLVNSDMLNNFFEIAMEMVLYNSSIERYVVLNYFLLEKGANPYQEIIGGWTAFLLAVRDNQINIIKDYITNIEVNVDQRKLDGWSALHLAASKGYSELVVILLKNGAATHIQNDDGKIPILLALKYNHIETFTLLFHHMQSKEELKNEMILTSLMNAIKEKPMLNEQIKNLIKSLPKVSSHSSLKLFDMQATIPSSESLKQGENLSPKKGND